MNPEDVQAGARVICRRPGYAKCGTIQRVDGYDTIFVALDSDVDAHGLQYAQTHPKAFFAADVELLVFRPRSEMQPQRVEEIEAALQAARASREAEEQRARNLSVAQAIEEAQRNAERSAGLQGNGTNHPIWEWARTNGQITTTTGVTATAQRFEEERMRLLANAIGGGYLELYRQNLARYGLDEAALAPVPPKAVPKPLAIGTPKRKLFLPPKP